MSLSQIQGNFQINLYRIFHLYLMLASRKFPLPSKIIKLKLNTEVEMAVKAAGKAMINMEANAMQRLMDLNKKIVDSMPKTTHKIMHKKPKTMTQEVMKKTIKIIHGLVRRKIPEFTTNL